jgi:hypothetical protein
MAVHIPDLFVLELVMLSLVVVHATENPSRNGVYSLDTRSFESFSSVNTWLIGLYVFFSVCMQTHKNRFFD